MSDDEFHDMHSRSGLWYAISNLVDTARVGPVLGTAINLAVAGLGVAVAVIFDGVIAWGGAALAIVSVRAVVRWVVTEL